MPRQSAVAIEKNFSKGLVTSVSPLNFPENAVIDANNCVFDFLGTVFRREGFNLEVGNVSKQANYAGVAISSFLWHNVLGDGSLNIYVVQVGNLLYFYPVSLTGAPLSAQLVSPPLDFTTMSSAANQNTLISANANPPVVGHIGDMTNTSKAFDGLGVQVASSCATKSGFNFGPTFSAYIGQNYTGNPQTIGSATIFGSSDKGLASGIKQQQLSVNPFTVEQDNLPFRTTINLRAKHSLPASSTDGTLLASQVYVGSTVTLVSNDKVTQWEYVWFDIEIDNVDISTNGSAWNLLFYEIEIDVAEVQFYSTSLINAGSQVPQFECQYASGIGYLFVTHPFCLPFVVSYTAGSPATYQATAITIKIRDFDGLDDGLLDTGVSTRPSTSIALAPQHLYNLYNQGWNSSLITTWQGAGTATGGDIVGTFTFTGTYPSNCDVWWQLKNASNAFAPATTLGQVSFGSSAAPKGRFIYDAFYIDRGTNTSAGVGGLGVVSSGNNRPSTVAFHAGRVFYSGVGISNYSNSIWFSQIISPTSSNVISALGNCFQDEDPTSETLFDLLPSDGGVIKIADCGQILKLFSMRGALIVFASNGIWTITGSQGLGFTANDYAINKLSSVRSISATSIVDVLGFPTWWTNEGIYSIKVDVSSGGLKVESLTYGILDSFYENIPRTCKQFARGAYNPLTFEVQWLFRSTAPVTIPDDNYKYDSILTFNTITSAFYPWAISPGANLASICVTDTGGETDQSPTNVTATFKYFVTYSLSGTTYINIADNFDNRYVDWFFLDSVGQTYESHFTSGYKLTGQSQRKFTPDYIYVFSGNEVSSAYRIQGLWNFAVTKASNMTSSIQLITNTAGNFSNLWNRIRVRGRGVVLSFKISSHYNDPFHILGWSVWETVAANV